MVLYGLYAKCEGENLGRIALPDDFTFTLDLESGSDTRKNVSVNDATTEQGIRDTHHLSIKDWRATLNIEKVDKKRKDTSMQAGARYGDCIAGGGWMLLALFDCRNMAITGVSNMLGVTVASEKGSEWKNVCDELEGWAEYCEKGNVPVYISEFGVKVETMKK